MSSQFARLLHFQQQVHDFLTGTLSLDISKMPKNIHYTIINCEKGVLDGIENPTSVSDKFRDIKYHSDASRLKLRMQIVDELFTKKQFKNDDKICLGKGGAIPAIPKRNKQAYILIGLPASGKSSVAAKISEKKGAIILDSDFAKRKLPEYHNFPWGASLVNSESSMIVFGNQMKTGFESLFTKVLKKGFNIVIPKIGSEPDDIIPYCESLKSLGYEVHLTLVFLPKEKSTVRALERLIKTNRYVPLAMIFDSFGNNPALTYFMLKNKNPNYIDTFGIINTDVPKKAPFMCTDLKGSNPANLFAKNKKSLI